MSTQNRLNYLTAGVDIDKGNRFVDAIRPFAKATQQPGVLGSIGGFGALFELAKTYQNPVLVACTDGVGTKLRLAMQQHRHHMVGIDLVAMSVNDLIVQGADPLFFLDYYATASLNHKIAIEVIQGISDGCQQAGCSLIGGETAEMPGMYQAADYDLAGFCVGAVEKNLIIDGSKVRAGDQLIALASSGPHANGFSLIRNILEISGQETPGNILHALLQPTRIYVKSVRSLQRLLPVHACAHITGGGLTENLPRVIPRTLQARIHHWEWPSIFIWLQAQGGIETGEMRRTFNCGIGMVICVPATVTAQAIEHLLQCGEAAWLLGEIEPSSNQIPQRIAYIPPASQNSGFSDSAS